MYLCIYVPGPRFRPPLPHGSGPIQLQEKSYLQMSDNLEYRCLCTLFAAFESQILPAIHAYHQYTTYMLSNTCILSYVVHIHVTKR